MPKVLVTAFLLASVILTAREFTEESFAHNRSKSPNSVSIAKGGGEFSSTRFYEGVVVVKFKEEGTVLGKQVSDPALNKRLDRHAVHEIKQAFPFLQYSTAKQSDILRRVHYVRYSSGENPVTVAADLAKSPTVAYAEPVPVIRRFENPNDGLFGQQRHFGIIQSSAAWDIVKGEDGNVVIAIVDGGTDWQHEDLRDNIWVNEDEIPNNGIDDDNNGFVDDIRGWNFANHSNDPRGRAGQPTNHQHGTHVAGIAVGVTNNAIGIAGTSWNCQLMPINISPEDVGNDSTLGVHAYDGVTYAAANGADIISLSWGNGFRSDLQQEVINFAHANGALVVAAAGNDSQNNDETPQYPANYNHVLSIGSTGVASDRKSSFSNYGVSVHLYAPGETILSTVPDNNYGFISGTSMATPLVAGVAGLVRTLYPDWTVEQVREQVRVTADNIDAANPNFVGLLGKGRVNALRAVTVTDLPSVRVVGSSFTDSGGDDRVDPGENTNLVLSVTNFLAPVSNVTFTISTQDPRINITNSTAGLANLSTGDTASVLFDFVLTSGVEDGYLADFVVEVSSAGYADKDLFQLAINPAQFISHDTGTLQVSITTQGNIGFIDFDQQSGGVGFVFNGSNLLFEGGLLIGTGVSTVSDCIRGGDGSVQDDDFKPASLLSIVSPGEVSDEYGTVVLEDVFAANPLGLKVIQESFAYQSEPFNDFIIFKYTIENTGDSALNNVHVGQFFDWDINAQVQGVPDFARFDQSRGLGFVQDAPNTPTKLAGTVVLTSPGVTSYRSIHNPNEIYGGDSGNGFTLNEKWNFLSGGIQTRNIDGVDVSTLTATGPFTLPAGEFIEVAFAVIGGGSVNELFINATAAQFLWDNDLVAEVDPRAPATSTSVLQNPAASKYADIVVVANQGLLNPPLVRVTVGTSTKSVPMSLIPGSVVGFRGPFEFTESGPYSIQTSAVGALNGVDSTQTRSFAVALAKPGMPLSLSTLNGRAVLQISKSGVRSETYFMGDYLESDGGIVYRFGPVKEFDEPMQLDFAYREGEFSDPKTIFVHQKQGEEWVPLPTQISSVQRRATVHVSRLGEFKLAASLNPDGKELTPTEFSLSQNFPNPFNPTTIIAYTLPQDNFVELTVFNALGQAIRTLYYGEQLAGRHQVEWDGRDSRGNLVASGVFFYRIKTETTVRTRKMILLR